MATKGTGNRGKGKKRKSRSRKILTAMIDDYLGVLTLNRGEMLKGIQALGGGHPDDGTFRRAMAKGEASDELAGLMLRYLRKVLKAAYDEGMITREMLPTIVRLSEWPEGHPMRKVGGTGREDGMMSRAECQKELSDIILSSRKKRILYASVGGGLALRSLVSGLGTKVMPKISKMVVWRISDSYGQKLIGMGLLGAGTLRGVERNMRIVENEKYPDGHITVTPKMWKGMSPFPGLMYGDVLFCGVWQYRPGGLNTIDGPMMKLQPSDGKEFEWRRDMLLKGD